LYYLFGDFMIKGVEHLFNKEIESVHCNSISLEFKFKDGTKYEFEDQGQNCCEKRYMNTDDCLSYYKDSLFVNATIEDGPCTESPTAYGDDADTQFLIVTTTKGQFTIVNYNEHNGYYGGFDIKLKDIT
jgi:hypothetical protein